MTAIHGFKLQLLAQATDVSGMALLLPPDALDWSVSAEKLASITASGLLQAKVPGAVTVRLREPGASLQSEQVIRVVAPPVGTPLWANVGADTRHTSQVARTGPSSPNNANTISYADIPKSISNQQFSFHSLVVGHDRTTYVPFSVYEADRSYSFVMNAILPDGSSRWSTSIKNVGSPPLSLPSPGLGPDGTVYTSIPSSTGGRIVALHGATGEILWQYVPADAASSKSFTGGAALVGPDGTVYVGTGSDSSGRMLALDGATGALKWQFDVARGSVTACPALGADGTLYFGSDGGSGTYQGGAGSIYALDSMTGSLKWSFDDTVAGFRGAPAIGADNTVYVVRRGTLNPGATLYTLDYYVPGILYAFDGATGTIKWQFTEPHSSHSVPNPSNAYTTTNGRVTPALGVDGTLYYQSSEAVLYALDPLTGVPKWTLDNADYDNGPGGGLFLDQSVVQDGDGVLYYGNTGGMYAVDTTGASAPTVKWHLPAPYKNWSPFSTVLGADGTLIYSSPLGITRVG